ncbi:MAG: TlpA disulfide reductase family protein [Bacteroidetes bacterium]|jgi:thiol-disulfide isomerase/thioredoxin|nr:TlpA disulfide reductase family protein [Bacteroidota bacterium]MDA0973387.1 TlpA disulfide reductase family protein [Bacteroidota bacterium]
MTLIKRSFILCLFTILWSINYAQWTTIEGDAPAYKGKEMLAFGYTDFISDRMEWLGRTTVDSSGHFLLKISCDEIRYIGLRTDHVTGFMYISPDASYTIEFPVPSDGVSITFNDRAQTDILFKDLGLEDINSLIIDFNERYEGFFAQNYQLLQRLFSPSNRANDVDSIASSARSPAIGGMGQLMERMESFIVLMDAVYKEFDNAYFKTYRKASLGDLLMNGRLDDRRAFYDRFIAPVEFNSQHKAQSELEQRFFEDYFLNFARTREDETLAEILNQRGSYADLFELLGKDDFLADPFRRNRTIVSAISEVWSNKSMQKHRLASILDSLGHRSWDSESRRLGLNALYVLSSMDDGFPAYDFKLTDQFNEGLSPSGFKGKPIVLEFWASWCTACDKERAIFSALADAYQGRIQFISINMDDAPMKENISAGPILHGHGIDDPTLKEVYHVMTLPQYTLIDRDGLIYDAFTMSPSAGLEAYLTALTGDEAKPYKPVVGSKEN